MVIKYGHLANRFLSSTANVQPFVNAVEIDWNDAELDDNTKINTTGDLLSVIQDLRNEVAELESKLAAQ